MLKKGRKYKYRPCTSKNHSNCYNQKYNNQRVMSLAEYIQKNTYFYSLLLLSIWSLLIVQSIQTRSIIRKSHTKKPQIEVRWFHKKKKIKNQKTKIKKRRFLSLLAKQDKFKEKKKKTHILRSTQLEANPLFNTFDKDFFYNNIIPENITYRYAPNQSVTKAILEAKLEKLFKEIYNKERSYTDFDILRNSNFNRRKKSGLLILKFKEYPFVVKVFMERPKLFVRPYSKGLYPVFFFNMGGGINRHLLGFTRVKNLHEIQKQIDANPEWANKIETPRKWHWVPKDCREIEIVGTNFGKKQIRTVIPGTYCIIADAIQLKNKTFSLSDKEARLMCMSLCNSLGVKIDPHIDNFLLEKNTDKIVIIDTEHFPSIVGLKGEQHFNGYVDWYYSLAKKCVNDMFFRSKKERYPVYAS